MVLLLLMVAEMKFFVLIEVIKATSAQCHRITSRGFRHKRIIVADTFL